MPLWFWRTYTATVTKSAMKTLACEKCGRGFAYEVTRTAKGYGDSLFFLDDKGAESRATRRAHRSCDRQLEKAIRSVPCPQCGWFQKRMVKSEKRKRLLYTSLAGFVVAWLVLFWEFFGPQAPSATQVDGGLSVGVFVGFLCAGVAWYFWYDSNRKAKRSGSYR